MSTGIMHRGEVMSKKIIDICPRCGDPINKREAWVMYQGEPYHMSCSAEEEDEVFFDRDMEFGDR